MADLEDRGKMIAFVYGLILFVYMEYIRHVDMSPDALNTHLWIFAILVFLGALAWAAVVGARSRP